MPIPDWALSLTFTLHLFGTVAWIGGLSAMILFILPAAQQLSDPMDRIAWIQKIQRRLDPLGWFSILLLLSTGLIQMSENQNYHGFLAISNRWAVAILLKHIVFLAMIMISSWITWGTLPELQRAMIRQAKGGGVPDLKKIQRRNLFLLRINLALGIIVLVFTAIARVSS